MKSGSGSSVWLFAHHPRGARSVASARISSRSASSIRYCVPTRIDRRRPSRIQRRTVSGLRRSLRAASGTVSIVVVYDNMSHAHSVGYPAPMEALRAAMTVMLALIMAVAGAAHFVTPRPFIQHLPDTVPWRAEIVAGTGVMELVLAAGLIGPGRFRPFIGKALAAYLVLVFPANIYAAVSQVPIDGIPTGSIRWARLPFQVPLIVAAIWATRRRS